MYFTIEDTDPDTGSRRLVDLTGMTVKFTAKKGSSVPVNLADCDLAANQTTTGKGECSYTFDATTTDLPAAPIESPYKWELQVMQGGGAPQYFPKNKDGSRTYGKLVVQEPLA
jgi:hypothetical protein